MITALVSLVVAGVIALVVFAVLMALLGLVLGTVFGLLALAIKLVPILFVGWLVVKLVRSGERRSRGRLSASDRQWLDA